MKRRTLPARKSGAAALAVLLLAGCGSGATTSHTGTGHAGSSAGSGSPDHDVVVEVRVQDAKVNPNGERVSARVGHPVTIRVTADRPGELHVHSTPERELRYGTGKTTLKVTIDRPGVVDVEDHIAEVVVVQLEVS